MKRINQFIKTAFSIFFTCAVIVAPISAKAQSTAATEAINLPAIDSFLSLKSDKTRVDQVKSLVQIRKFGPESDQYGSSSVVENYDQQDFLSDDISMAFKKRASNNGWVVKAYKAGISKSIASSFPKPDGWNVPLTDFSLRDYALIASDESGRIKAVLFRWFSIAFAERRSPQWVQFAYVAEGSAAKTIENKLTTSMLSEFLLPQ